MKKIFTTLAIIATCSVALAQSNKSQTLEKQVKKSVQGLERVSANQTANQRTLQNASFGFEASEGFTPGSINGQNGWAVTSTNAAGTEFVMNQLIATDLPYAGEQSLIIAQDPRYPQITDDEGNSNPIVGADYTKADSNPDNISLYFQTTLDGATNYEFATVSSDGSFYRDRISPDLTSEKLWIADFEILNWVPTISLSDETWYKLDIVKDATARTITYKVDNQVVHTRTNVNASEFEWKRLYLNHDNAGLSTQMSIDNLTIGEATLGLNNNVKESKLSVYPNPTTSFINIQNNDGEKIESITIGDLTGRTVKYVDQSSNKINVQDLPKGVYLLKIKTDKGFKIEKIIKK